jgi:hypothetical protein
MFMVDASTADAIRRAYQEGGELFAVVELRRHFPGITDNEDARRCVRSIAGWTPIAAVLPVQKNPEKQGQAVAFGSLRRSFNVHSNLRAPPTPEAVRLRDVMGKTWNPPRWFFPYVVQRPLEGSQIELLIDWICRQLCAWASLTFWRQRQCRRHGATAVATGCDRSDATRKMNPLPLIKVTVQLTKRSQCISQAFKIRKLFRLTFLQMPVGLVSPLIHDEPSVDRLILRDNYEDDETLR